MELNKQYNKVVGDYQKVFGEMNRKSIVALNTVLDPILKNDINYALDFGCGLGDMINYLQGKNITCAGVDSSSEMVALAVQNTDADVRCEDFAHTSFENESFDLITSKWAMQTSALIDPIYTEAHRLLKTGGHFVFLVVHPIRQFLEKKKTGKDYFKKEIVGSIIFDGAITVYEPSHTMKEWLSETFLSLFTLKSIDEGAEFPAAEQIGGDIYPTYLIIIAQKK
ncbi:MAG: hypothetical protein QG669_402 [Patescibacteria group bacterium]|jgi:SAM-dependent methyltransferase|nr:hypothetical protein [Patescibacteria group bacterium]